MKKNYDLNQYSVKLGMMSVMHTTYGQSLKKVASPFKILHLLVQFSPMKIYLYEHCQNPKCPRKLSCNVQH